MALSQKPLSMITIPARSAPDAGKIAAHISAETIKPAPKPAAKPKPDPKPEPASTATHDAMAAALAALDPATLATLLLKAGVRPNGTTPVKAKPEAVSKPVGGVGTLPAPVNQTYTLADLREMADRDPVCHPLAGYIGGNVLVTSKSPLGNRTMTAAATVISVESKIINSKGRSFPAPVVWCYNSDHGISRQAPFSLGELDTMPDDATVKAGLKAYHEAVKVLNYTGTIDTVYKSGATVKTSDGRRCFAKRDNITQGHIVEGAVIHFTARVCDVG